MRRNKNCVCQKEACGLWGENEIILLIIDSTSICCCCIRTNDRACCCSVAREKKFSDREDLEGNSNGRKLKENLRVSRVVSYDMVMETVEMNTLKSGTVSGMEDIPNCRKN